GVDILWIALIAVLPITSMPLVARFTGGSMVAPPSMIFMGILFLVWFIPYLAKRGKLPRQVIPVLMFVVIAIISAGLTFFRDTPPYYDQNLIRNILEGVLTLGIGVCFYLLTAGFAARPGLLEKTIRVINWSGLILLAYCMLQFSIDTIYGENQTILTAFHHFFSSGSLVFGRVSGFAMEPSWLAHQLNMLYLPIWLACTVQGYSAHRIKIWKFSLESFLLVGMVAILYLSYSRSGLFAFLLMIAWLFLELNQKVVKYVHAKITHGREGKKVIPIAVISISMVLLYLVLFVGIAYILTKTDHRMATLFTFETTLGNPILRYADSLKFGERVTYWISGWNIFNDFSLFGVGLGVAGFYLANYLPSFAWQLVEVRRLVFWVNMSLNVKSLWFRLLAETGIIGFMSFMIWGIVNFFTSRALRVHSDPLAKVIGLGGIFFLLAFVIEGFSIDSFALPYYWVMSGLIAAASQRFLTPVDPTGITKQ
ncbi:MAG TPA: O-antigen ligase family protein, partial [Longilinea sp.]|nr:O-antigen ligase family protein [Longilinea sp.]